MRDRLTELTNYIEERRALKKGLLYGTFFVGAALFILLFALWESPFYEYWYGCDASFFSMVGRGITMGLAPYKDFWDLKGPYFFFLQALGQFMHHDRLGVYLLEVPFQFFSMVLIYELSRLFHSRKKSIALVIVFLFGHISTLWGGNTLEEMCLPFSLLCVYLTVRHVRRGGELSALTPLPSAVIGFSIGFILFSKITVAAPIMGICIAIVCASCIDKNLKGFLHFLLYALMGFLIAIVPVFIYFAYHGNIGEMLYAVFVFAFKRSVAGDTFTLDWELKLFGTYFAFIFAICHKNELKRDYRIMLIAASITTYLLLHLGNPFIYYFTTVYPVLMLALVLFLDVYNPLVIFTRVKQAVCLLLFLILSYYYATESVGTLKTVVYGRNDAGPAGYYIQAQELASLIPEFERDQVFSFSTDMTWFEANQIMPCYKYVVNLQFFISLDPRIEDNIKAYFDATPPKWMVIGPNFENEIPSLYEYCIRDKYEMISSNDSGGLYLRID